jgi:hypothetical protein
VSTETACGGLASLFGELVGYALMGGGNRSLKRQLKRAMREAERENHRAEERANERQRAWLRLMQRQANERRAGDASRDDVRRLLSGQSGRRNPLDARKFRPVR